MKVPVVTAFATALPESDPINPLAITETMATMEELAATYRQIADNADQGLPVDGEP